MGVLNIGASALQTAYTQMQTTSHNIANASTPGYSRQETRLAATLGSYQQGMFLGGGVEVSGVERQYDAHLNREVHAAGSAQASDAVRSASLGPRPPPRQGRRAPGRR